MTRFFNVLAAFVLVTVPASAATIVVNHDEWTLSDTGFASAPTTTNFVNNLVAELGPLIHAYSTNFGFTGGALATAMANAGATYTTGTGFAFTLPNISAFDAIFLGGNYLSAAEIDVLTDYVAGGGNVYIAGGTGVGGAAAEAAAWNGFLMSFGLQLDSVYNGVNGAIPVSGDSLTDSVISLFFNNGSGITGSGVFCCERGGLLAVVRTDDPDVIPVPGAIWLLMTGLAGVAGVSSARRRRTA